MPGLDGKKIQLPAFIADCHLGKLAKYLRFMRVDTLYFSQIGDNDLITLALEQNRIILTRDRALSRRKNIPVFFLESKELSQQLQTLTRHFHLNENTVSSSRCIICNTPLQIVEKGEIEQRLPKKVAHYFSYFEYCPHCDRIYWHGDHYRRMKKYLESVLSA